MSKAAMLRVRPSRAGRTMTAMADAGLTGGSSDTGPPSSDEEVLALKHSLQDLRRRMTLLNADMQTQIEAREAVQARLMEAHMELAASRDRRKEMARVIVNREDKIAQLKADLQARYEELATMQRYVARSGLLGRSKWLLLRLRKAAKKLFSTG